MLDILKLKTEKPFPSGLLSSDVFDIVNIISFVLVGRWICFSVIRCFDIVSLCWWIVEPVSFFFYSLVCQQHSILPLYPIIYVLIVYACYTWVVLCMCMALDER